MFGRDCNARVAFVGVNRGHAASLANGAQPFLLFDFVVTRSDHGCEDGEWAVDNVIVERMIVSHWRVW